MSTGRCLNSVSLFNHWHLICLFRLDPSHEFVRYCGRTTPSTLIKDAAVKVNEVTGEVENKHVVAMALVVDE